MAKKDKGSFQVFEKQAGACGDKIHNFTSRKQAKAKVAELTEAGTFNGFWDCNDNILSRRFKL